MFARVVPWSVCSLLVLDGASAFASEVATSTTATSSVAHTATSSVAHTATPTASQALPVELAVEEPPPSYDITVVATRVAKTAGSAHVIRGKQLERFDYDDSHAVLTMVPGVYTRGEDGVGLRPNIGIRGVNPDRSKKIALLEDGILFAPAPYSAPAAYFFPLMTRMQQVRVIKGPASISYGPQTIGGAIDLVTRAFTSTLSGALDVAGGEHMYGKAHGWLGTDTGRTGFMIEGVHLREDGFKTLPDDSSTGFVRNEWMLKGRHAFDDREASRNELQLKATYSDESSRETYLGLAGPDFEADPLRRYFASKLDTMKYHRTSVVATHLLGLTRDISLRTSFYRHDLSRTWRKVNGFLDASIFDVLAHPELADNQVYLAVLRGQADSTDSETILIGPNQRDFVSQGVETRLSAAAVSGAFHHRIEAGLRVHYDRVERRHSQDRYLAINGDLVPAGRPTEVTAFEEASTIALAAHATDAVTIGDLTLTPGVRFELFRSELVDHLDSSEQPRWVNVLLPGLGAYYAVTDHFGVLAGVHRGFSPPAPGTKDVVEPELNVSYEGGARFSRGFLRAEVIGFYNDYSNLTDVCTFSSSCPGEDLDRQFDAGDARIYGFEAYAEHELRLGRWKLPFSAAYTFTQTEFRETFNSEDPIFGPVEAGDEIPYVPKHQARITLGLETDAGGLVIGGTYVGAMREQAGDEPLSEVLSTDEQLLFDVGGTLKMFGPVVLYLNVRNLLDSTYVVSRRPFGARPNAPRWVQVGLRVASF